jgi:hypothetical protein
MKSVLWLAVFLALGLTNCNSGPDPVEPPAIRILEPKPGATVKLNDDFRILTESDYDRFAQKLTFTATTDSGKTWQAFIISLKTKTGMKVMDTVVCNFGALGFAAGQTTRIKVIEYGKVHFAISELITIQP